MQAPLARVHFVGIGGFGMSAIAELVHAQGTPVSGSDLQASAATQRLRALGATVSQGHAAEHVRGARAVVASAAVAQDNPELVEARRLGIPVIARGQMLAELTRGKQCVAVAGSHGKTTTSSMIASVLELGGLDPTVVVGGRLLGRGTGARHGRSPYVVVETDESDRSFLLLSPSLAIVTNVDREHLDAYRDLADVQRAFVQFANAGPAAGAAIVCLDDGPTRELLGSLKRRVVSYGLTPEADVAATDVETLGLASRYTAVAAGERLGEIELRVPGRHNVVNSLAAIAAGRELRLTFDSIRRGLQAFRGVERRFEIKGEAGGVTVIDDYGHHPTEIRATLQMLRRFAGGRRTLVLFQPHRFTRTQALFEEFVSCFAGADVLLLASVYAASEKEIPGADAERLAQAIASRGGVAARYAGDVAAGGELLIELARPGDVVLTLGAGNVPEAGELLLAQRGGAVA